MIKLSLLTFLANCVAWLIAFYRICTSQGEVFDYYVALFTFGILVYDICRYIKTHSRK